MLHVTFHVTDIFLCIYIQLLEGCRPYWAACHRHFQCIYTRCFLTFKNAEDYVTSEVEKLFR